MFWKYLDIVAEAAHRIQEAERNEIISDTISQNWLKHFKNDELSFEMKLRNR